MDNTISQLPLLSLLPEKRCSKCKKVKSLDDFYLLSKSAAAKLPVNSKTMGREAKCIECKTGKRRKTFRRKEKKTSHSPMEGRRYLLKKEYDLTVEDYQMMFDAQNGLCAICKRPEAVLVPRTGKPRCLSVDHNHETNKVRGLLCYACNRSLGSYEKFKALAWLYEPYLEQYG